MSNKVVMVTFTEHDKFGQRIKSRYENVDDVEFKDRCIVIKMCKTVFYIPMSVVLTVRIDE